MLRKFELAQRKKKLYLDSLHKFTSVIKKQKIDAEVKKELSREELAFSSVKSEDGSAVKKQQNQNRTPNKQKTVKFGLMDQNFQGMLSLSHIDVDSLKLRRQGLKSSKKLTIDDQLQRTKKTFSLPRLVTGHNKQQSSKYIHPLEEKWNLVEQMTDALKDSGIFIEQHDKLVIKKEDMQNLINYVMRLARTESRKDLQYLHENFPKFSNLSNLSSKVFLKRRERSYKTPKKLKLCSSMLSMLYNPNSKGKKNQVKIQGCVQKGKSESEVMQLIDLQSIQNRMKAMSNKPTIESLHEEKQNEKHQQKMKQGYKRVKACLNEYNKAIMSPQLAERLAQMHPLTEIQHRISEEIKDFYKKIIHDPLLVPALKEKLLNSLIAKVIKNFKVNISSISKVAQEQSQSILQYVQKMKEWMQMHKKKEEYFVHIKKDFIIEIKRLAGQLDDYLAISKRGLEIKGSNVSSSLSVVLGFLAQASECCQKIVFKFTGEENCQFDK